MYLKKISLFNYKNFSEANFEFDGKIICFVGKNGIGKTNVLDAIYHLAYGKSYFNPLAVQNIKHGEEFFVIDAEFIKKERSEQVVCSLKKGQKKVLKRNGKAYDKFSDHIGFIPLVIISPADRDLIVEGSETRRKFMDSVISQLNPNYLQQLIQYQKEQLNGFGDYIFEKRKEFVAEFIPIFNAHHHAITGSQETVQLVYESHLFEKNLITLLQENINKDRALHYTSVGTHKDDLSFEIDGHPIKKFGSQGQQKSFLIALKLAQFEFLKKQSGVKPILLFDDIFDKLDESRVAKIIEMVNSETFGQLFISDTHPERTEAIVKSTHQSYKIFNL